MSRLDEVEAEIDELLRMQSDWTPLCRTLAAEVDARDEVIAELLAMLKPDKHRPSWEHDEYRRACEIAGRTE